MHPSPESTVAGPVDLHVSVPFPAKTPSAGNTLRLLQRVQAALQHQASGIGHIGFKQP